MPNVISQLIYILSKITYNDLMRFFGLSVTLKWNKWVWKTGLPHFYASRNCVYHSIAVCEFVCIRYNRIWFVDSSARLTLKFDGWTNISIGHLFHALRSFVCHYIAICELKLRVADRKDSIVANRRFFARVTLDTGRMVSTNNGTPQPFAQQLCVPFDSHL